MIRQLKDFIEIDDILVNGTNCITALFTSLGDTYNPYLKQILNTDKDSLSLDYLGNRLDKILSPLYSRLIDKYIADGDTDDEAIQHANAKLIKIIESKYLYNWNRLADAMFKDYNPINNYDMVETREVKEQTDRSVVTEGQNEIVDSTESSTSETNNTSVSESGLRTSTNSETAQKSVSGSETVNTEENSESEVNETSNTSSSNSTTETKQEEGATRTTTSGEIITNDVEQQKYAGFNTDSPKIVTETSKNGDTTETHSGTSSETHSGTNTASSSGSVTETKEGTNTESKEGTTSRSETGTESNEVSGSQREVNESTGSTTESKSGSGSESHTGSATSTSTTETEGMLEDNRREEELRRSGNIGVTTSQQMIQSEIELRKHNLEDIIFNNMDEVLFLDYYL